MPRDNDNDNASSRGRRDGPSGGKGRSGAKRGPEKKFAKRGFGKNFADKRDGERRPDAGKTDGTRSYRKKPHSGAGKPYGGDREGRPPRRDGAAPRPRGDRPFVDRPSRFNRDDRPSRGEGGERRSFTQRDDRGDDKRPYTPRGDRSETRPAGRWSERTFGDRKSDASRDRGERYGDRGNAKPWQKREGGPRDDRGGDRPRFSRSRDDRTSEDRPKFGKPRFDKRRGDGEDRPRFSRGRDEHSSGERPFRDRPKFDRARDDRPRDDRRGGRSEGRSDWHEHPRSDRRADRFADRPRRDNEDDSRIFAKRPAFGGRGAYRERKPDFDKRAEASQKPKKSGERIAKVLARAGLASRRDAEEMVVQGRVTVNGRVINSPALDVTANDVVAVDGAPLPPRERTRLFIYHKPRGLMTTHADPEGRPTVFDNLPEGLPRLISVGRLDFNTEGLLLLTNDGGLARELELPETGWLRRYRVRAHGEVTQAQLDALKDGVEVDGVKYGPVDATLERDQGANVWLVFAIREGKNREVRNVLAHLGLEVNRLIRVSYGPFQLGELAEGAVDEVKTRVLREQLGDKVIARSGADFGLPGQRERESSDEAPRGKKPFKPAGKSALVADRKGRRVLVQRTGSEEARARNEFEANGYGPPRRPKRGYHGKRDLKPRDE
ncbi:pseudouridine synthase [Bradyrhizobium sp.]|uniref:pseudouridine synthase n=1 Tax=Bradyrhizobium sp. TaxID=376 RepID=UPI001EC3EBC6|nr:pseudouridine synthase [Bradyrhizobium sp.]MBV9984395.1 pseudouridine synthase [Bradyrhizobium sp.]